MRRFYGWKIAWALAITETVSYGVLYYAFSVYIVPLETAFGWSRAAVSGALSIALLMTGILAVPVGFWLDRYGARGLMTVGSILGTVLFAISSQVDTLFGLYLVWAGIGVAMTMVLYEPAFVVVAKWFDQQRGTAMAIVTFVAGFASTIFLPLTNWLLENFGRINSQLILAAILGAITIPLHAFVLRRDPADLGLMPDGAPLANRHELSSSDQPAKPPSTTLNAALRKPTFWWIAGGFALASVASFGLRVHMIPLLISRDFSAEFAATATGIIGAMQVLGRIIFGPIGDRFNTRHVVIALFAAQTVALILLRFSTSIVILWVFIVLVGAVNGAMTLARPMMVAALYGTESYGRISSIMQVLFTLAITIGPFVIGLLFTQFGSYNPALSIVIVVSIISTWAISRIEYQPT